MSLLSPTLIQRLVQSRLVTHRGLASVGVGERRSRSTGPGIEFADHRPYQQGDDIRYLDRHVYARLGQHHVRRFSVYQQLPVTILVDASASMRFGRPSKFDLSRSLAAGLAYAGLAGGDRVQLGVFAGKRIEWFRPLHGVGRAPPLVSWLEQRRTGRHADLAWVARSALPKLAREGMLIVVSDWMVTDADVALKTLKKAKQDLVAVQVLAPEEEEPERLGQGEVRFVDSESGHEVELSLDTELAQRYRHGFDEWKSRLQETVLSHGGRLLRVRSDADPEQTLLTHWRTAGLIA